MLVAVAVVVLVVVGVALAVLLARSRAEQSRTSASSAALASLVAAPDAVATQEPMHGGGQAAVVVSPTQGTGVLVVAGIQPPPPSETYQAWLITPEGAATSAGTFVPDGHGDATLHLAGTTGTAVVGVTLEPSGGSPQPTTGVLVALAIAASSESPSASGSAAP